MSAVDSNLLKEHLFFRDFPVSLIDFLEPLAEVQTFAEGETIIQREEDADAFYLVKEGLVSVQLNDPTDGEIEIETLSEGDPLGWSWAHPPYVWQFTAKASSDVECYTFPAEELRERCQMEPELGYRIYRQLLKTVSDRLAGTRFQLLQNKDVELPEGMTDLTF